MPTIGHGGLVAGLLALLVGCGAPAVPLPPQGTDTSETERALVRAVRYLAACQSADGAWRSDTYGTFKDGTALTPLVLYVLETLPAHLRPERSCDRAAGYLAAMVRRDGTIAPPADGFDYPLYTAAISVTVL